MIGSAVLGSPFRVDGRGAAETVDESNEPVQPVIDGVLQDLLVEVGVSVREHIPHADDLRPVLGCFSLKQVLTYPADGVNGDLPLQPQIVTQTRSRGPALALDHQKCRLTLRPGNRGQHLR